MFGRSVGIAATCALSASAFIIPPGVAPAAHGEHAHDLSLQQVNPKSRTLVQTCPSCAFPWDIVSDQAEDEVEPEFWIQGGSNSLVFNFGISEDGKWLQLSGANIYSPSCFGRNCGRLPVPTVRQIPSNTDLSHLASSDLSRSAKLKVTGYGLEESDPQALSPDGDMLVPLTFRLEGLEKEPIELGEIGIKLLKTSDGELLIMQVEVDPRPRNIFDHLLMPPPAGEEEEDFPHPPPPPFSHHPYGPPPFDAEGAELPPCHHPPHGPPPFDREGVDFPPPPTSFHGPPHGPPHGPHGPFGHKECDVLPEPLCKLKNIIDAKIDAALGPAHRHHRPGCPGRQGQHGPPTKGGPQRFHGRPHHVRPHNRYHRHHRFWRHGLLRAFAKGLVTVLIPVFAGITVGMSVSLLGLVVGRIVTFLWRTFVRGNKRGYVNLPQDEIPVVQHAEGKMVLAEMEAPPLYDSPVDVFAPPRYEDVKSDTK
ncbi:hypothetical protein LTR78_003079 [Recurvomyces mirabilis]|uniref:Uncharacterized protein n=1 Tax=Recurvomyces mirabilis TaxID=574656 RepID=A0AAE0WRU1_9PEZI|nr:hypothetical protein LTR78_003079 [Recurvomyces mirabilis]